MTNQEFSNTFDTLLNSYRDKKQFGDTSSVSSIELDEYEKSVLLTQAQDIIVKSYFDRTLNQQGQGFDTSERRQIDFSELVTINEPTIVNNSITVGALSVVATSSGFSMIISIISEGDISISVSGKVITLSLYSNSTLSDINTLLKNNVTTKNEVTITSVSGTISAVSTAVNINGVPSKYDDRSVIYLLPSNILFILNEKIKVSNKNYVIVPINYNEYDRLMSKPFAEPLKKQAWRLFQSNIGYDLMSEIIPITGVTPSTSNYVIRYVRRPSPIILISLTGDLSIDGVTSVSECELNPIIHIDILLKAVELAYFRMGGGSQKQESE